MENFDHLRQRLISLKPKFLDWNVTRVRVFGSFAKDQATSESDIDIILDFKEKPNYFRFLNIEDELAHTLNRKIDLFTEDSIHYFIKSDVLKEAKDVW